MWILVALEDQKVAHAAVLETISENQFRSENRGREILLVKGRVTFGQPLSDDQRRKAFPSVAYALNTRQE